MLESQATGEELLERGWDLFSLLRGKVVSRKIEMSQVGCTTTK
jgi:hypothetical protein